MSWHLEVDNVAGIVEGSATVEPGLNAVRASNWQGKSSFVEAIKTALGVSTSLTEGKSSGGVTLTTPDRTVAVDLRRENGAVHRDGTPYLADDYDRIRTELFACLDESNEVRRTVREGKNLEEILLRPLDFQNIDQRIADLKREREQVDSELAGAREARKRLPTITEKVTRLESELADLHERREELASDDGDDDGVRGSRSDLAGAQSDRDRVANRVERLESGIERTETRLAEKRSELADVEVDDDADPAAELAEAREELDDLRGDVEVLQSLHSATELVLSQDRLDLVTDVQRDLTGDTVVCWTCGSEADRGDIETRVEELGERIADRRASVSERRDRVERLETRREELAQARRRKQDLEAAIEDLEDRLADQRGDLETAREELADLDERVADLSESVDRTVEEITDVESEIKYREAELSDLQDERDSLESRAERVDTLTDARDDLDAEIEELRNRKDEITFRTREAFDAAMQDVLAAFDTGFESARLTGGFDLVVARDGREASLDALSEGELELLGFVAALAGYAAFDVAETVPILLVDGVGGLADDNLHTLVDYLEGRTEYLVFTVYPEYGAFDGHEISPADWTIASATSAE